MAGVGGGSLGTTLDSPYPVSLCLLDKQSYIVVFRATANVLMDD